MKKSTLLLTLALLLTLSACAPAPQSQTYTPPYPAKTGIAPVELTAREEIILDSFDLVGSSEILTFNAPKETNSIIISVCTLQEDGTWLHSGGGSVSTDMRENEDDNVVGSFALTVKDKCAMEYKITFNGGGFSNKVPENDELDVEIIMSAKMFLTEFTPIELNTEIPVAIMAYTGKNEMRSSGVESYNDPSVFAGMDFVQAITIEFSGKSIEED